MNGQQYSRSAVRFSYYAVEAVVELSPSSGLIGGSTVVRVLGNGFRPFDVSLCRFATAPVEATRRAAARCAAYRVPPTAWWAHRHDLPEMRDHEEIMETADLHVCSAWRDGEE